jgi:hypothetical protein
MSKLEGADRDAELRRLIREHAVNVGREIANHGVPEGSRVKVDASTKICSSWAEKD